MQAMEIGIRTVKRNFPKARGLSKSTRAFQKSCLSGQKLPVFFSLFHGVLPLFDPSGGCYLHSAGARKLLQNQEG
jgi:hypothetical protein